MSSLNKKITYAILSLILGLFLVWLALQFTSVNAEQFFATLQNLNLLYAGLVLASTFFNLWLTAYRWRLITGRLTVNKNQSLDFFLFYVTLGTLVSQVIPQSLGMIGVRSFALRFHRISTLSKSFFTVIYDQVFDLLIPLLLLPPALLFVLRYISLSTAVFTSLSILAIALYVVKQWHKFLIFLLTKGYYLAKKQIFRHREIIEVESVSEPLIFETKFTVYLFCLAVIRYANLVLRGFLVVLAGSLKIKFWAIIFSTPLLQLAMVLSFTPANLGLMELSWIGVLKLFKVPATESLIFSLLQRILFLLSIVLCFITVFVYCSFFKFKREKKDAENF